MFNIGDVVDILDNLGNTQTTVITDISADGKRLTFRDPLQFNLSLTNKPRIVLNGTSATNNSASSKNTQVSIPLSIVDVTPIVQGHDVSNPGSLQPYDIARVPFNTSYDDLNLAKEYIQKQIKDIPTIDGNGVIRILPITEDNIKTVEEKTQETDRLLLVKPSTPPPSQELQNTTDVPVESGSGTNSNVLIGEDYSLETPIYLSNGYSTSSMKCFATSFTKKNFPYINIPGLDPSTDLMVKSYQIYPVMTIYNSLNAELAKQYFEPISVDFTPPIFINSEKEDKKVLYYCEKQVENDAGCSRFAGYEQKFVDGIYAGTTDTFTITYTVTNKFALIDGNLNIRIYSNKITDLDALAASTFDMNSQTVNNTSQNTKDTKINIWRTDVINNPSINILSDTSVNAKTDGDNIDQSQFRNAAVQYANLTNGQLNSSSTTTTNFYENASQWTQATQYANYDYTIPIVKGKAVLVIPASDIVSLLFVEASVGFGDNYEAIAMDFIFVANPISISGVSPYQMTPNENQTFEIGANISWEDGTNIIDDNTIVNFTVPTTQTQPTSSVTNNGWAGGIFLGPKSPIILPPIDPKSDNACPETGIEEVVTINVFHSSGYTRTATRKIFWNGTRLENIEDASKQFYFVVNNPTETIWADGTINPNAFIKSDLSDPAQGQFITEDDIAKLEGYLQKDDLPVFVYSGNTTPSKQRWNNGIVQFLSTGLNQNIGHEQPVKEGEQKPSPWNKEITVSSVYKDLINDVTKYRYGTGITGIDVTDTGIVPISPLFKFAEPLGITLSTETTYARDGITTSTIVADVTWKNLPILNTNNPYVTFESGICAESNGKDGKMTDTRNTADGCLVIQKHPNAILEKYSVQISPIRTDINTNGLNIHTHACILDTNGNGNSTSTIILSGTIVDHTHVITNYISDTILSHSHGIRSVAITTLNPTTDTITDFVVNGYVIYDPTNCVPYGDNSSTQNQNRMMFSSVYFYGAIPESYPKLLIEMNIGSNLSTGTQFPDTIIENDVNGIATSTEFTPTFYSSITPTNTARGFDIKASAKWSSYKVGLVTIPEAPVIDCSRIVFETQLFRETTDESVISAPGTVRPYLTLNVKAKIKLTDINGNEQTAETSRKIIINSVSQWIPNIAAIVPEITNDSLYLTNALDKIGFFGASQIHDAVKESAQRIIKYQTDYPLTKNYKKIIILLSDGDENSGEVSISNAISNINIINGNKQTPVLPIQLGQTYGSDDILMIKYANLTDGYVNNAIDFDATKINDLINSVLTNKKLSLNQYTYSDIISLTEESLLKTLSLPSVTLPTGTTIEYRYKTSDDAQIWSVWSDWKNSSETSTFEEILENKTKYISYEVKMFGNGAFVSPSLNSNASLSYLKPQNFTIIFNPVSVEMANNEYISSVQATHQSVTPSTSTVGFSFSQSPSIDLNDFINIVPDQHTFIPTRYNEIMQTSDYKVYYALNGRWAEELYIAIYRVNNGNIQFVPASDYIINASEGSVTFIARQNISDSIRLCIQTVPYFRLACNIVNYGESAAVINHVGLIYNVMKRVQ